MHFTRYVCGSALGLAATFGAVSCSMSSAPSSDGSRPPTISRIEDQTILQAQALAVAFAIDDEQPDTVQITPTSSDTSLVAKTDIEVLGSGSPRTLRVLPNPAGTGEVDIALLAEDVDGNSSTEAFTLTVEPSFRRQLSKLIASDAAAEDGFGLSISIDGDYVIVGARGSDDAGSGSGSAYVFRRSGDAWTELAKLAASDAEAGDSFGRSVDVSGDYFIVGAPDDDDAGVSSGSAYVFMRSGDAFTEVGKLTASDAAGGDYFGVSVGISGDYAVVGAYGDDDAGASSGAAYVYRLDGDEWTEIGKLTGSDVTATAFFGLSVAIDGDSIVVGANEADGLTPDSGAAFVFERDGDSWPEVGKLMASDGATMDLFGESVAISGDHIVVGAHFDDDDGEVSGSAYVFRRGDAGWNEMAKLTARDASFGDTFGRKVAIDGDHIVVGANRNCDAGARSGSAYVFRRSDDAWFEVAKLTADDAAAEARFGSSVAVWRDYVAVGAVGDDSAGSESGSAYVYRE